MDHRCIKRQAIRSKGGQVLPALLFTPVACGIHRPFAIHTGLNFAFPRSNYHRLPLPRRNGMLDDIAVAAGVNDNSKMVWAMHANTQHIYIHINDKSHCSKCEMHTNEQNDMELATELPLMCISVYPYTNTYTTSV